MNQQKGQLPGQPGQQEVAVTESAVRVARGGRPRKAERFVQISAVLPPDLKRKFFAAVPPGSRSAFIASLLASKLDAMEESAAACQALEAEAQAQREADWKAADWEAAEARAEKVTPVTPQG